MENIKVVDADGHITDSEERISAYLEELSTKIHQHLEGGAL